jgi:hypothetical protein
MSVRGRGRRHRPAIRSALVLAAACGIIAGAARAGPGDRAIGPGVAHTVIFASGYRIDVSVSPNLGGRISSTFRLHLTRAGQPVDAAVDARFTMPAMPMPSLALRLHRTGPGLYQGSGEKLTMPGRWLIDLELRPSSRRPFHVILTDLAIVE